MARERKGCYSIPSDGLTVRGLVIRGFVTRRFKARFAAEPEDASKPSDRLVPNDTSDGAKRPLGLAALLEQLHQDAAAQQAGQEAPPHASENPANLTGPARATAPGAPDVAERDPLAERFRKGRRASYREGAMFGALAFGSAAFAALISAVVTSRLYGINAIGAYSLAIATITALRVISNTKERPALVRELALLDAGQPRVTALFLATLTFSVAITCLAAAVALVVVRVLLSGPVSRPALFPPLAVMIAGYALITNTSENLDVVAGAFRAGRQLFWMRLVDVVAFIAIAAPLAAVDRTVWGLVIATISSQLISLLHRSIRMRRFMRLFIPRDVLREGFRTLPGMLRFGLKIAPGAVADGGSNESGTWIVASFSSISATGAYGRAYLLAKALASVNQFASEMLFPTLLERRAKGDGPGYARALVDTLRYTTTALLLVAAAAGGVAQGIMRVFGPGFERADTALVILLAYPVLFCLSQFQRFALLSLDRPWLGTISGLLRFGVTMAGAVLLTWKLGPYGAAIGLAIGLVADLAFSTRFVMRHLETPFVELWPLRQRLVLAVAYAGGFVAGRFTYHLLPWELGVVAGALAGAVVFVAVLWLGRAVNERDKERYRDIRRGITRRRARPAAPIVASTQT